MTADKKPLKDWLKSSIEDWYYMCVDVFMELFLGLLLLICLLVVFSFVAFIVIKDWIEDKLKTNSK